MRTLPRPPRPLTALPNWPRSGLSKTMPAPTDLGYTLLRYFNAAGADPGGDFGEDRRHEAHLIPLIFQAAVGRRPKVMIYGDDYPTPDGTCVRDYVHTADLAQAHQLAVESLEPGMGRAYNLGSGTGATVLEVLRACETAAGRPIPHEIAGRRPGDPGRADCQPREDHPRAGLVAPPFRHPRDCPDRLGVASPPSRRLLALRGLIRFSPHGRRRR